MNFPAFALMNVGDGRWKIEDAGNVRPDGYVSALGDGRYAINDQGPGMELLYESPTLTIES